MNITITHKTEATVVPPAYGVWLKGKGWLSVVKGEGQKEPVAFVSKKVANQIAKLCKGKVRFIDDSLKDLEKYLVSIEEENGK